jgi:hypothetical protein
MTIDSVSSSIASASTAIAVKQLKAINEAQIEVMRALAESQAQMTQMLRSEGIGRSVDIHV